MHAPKGQRVVDNAFSKSPTSLKVRSKHSKEDEEKSITDVLHQEFRLSQRCVEGHDFCEGIRALLVDKDGQPKWQPAHLEEITNEMIEAYFAPLTDRDELFATLHVNKN